MSSIKLKPDRSLLCPDFDGYKLSSGSGLVTTYSKSVPEGISATRRTENSSYLHTRLDALHNCLTADIPDAAAEVSSYVTVYCYNKRGHLLAYDYSNETQLCGSRQVWEMQLTEDTACVPSLLLPDVEHAAPASQIDESSVMFGVLHPSLTFANDRLAVAADGRSGVYVIHTEDRTPQAHHTWTTVFRDSEIGAYEVADARFLPTDGGGGGASAGDESGQLHVLLVAVAPPSLLPVAPPPQHSKAPSLHLITWLTLSIKDGVEFTVERERLYVGSALLEYCQFDQECSSIVLLTHQHYSLLHDSSKPRPEAENKQQNGKNGHSTEDAKPLYTYQQTDDEVTIQLRGNSSLDSSSLSISVASKRLTIAIRGGDTLLTALFLHPVDADTATWTVVDGKIEVCVCKSLAGERWLRLFEEEHIKGEEILDHSQVEEAADRLAHLTAETWGGNGCEGEEKPAYNPGELDSCDDAESDLFLLLLEGEGDNSVQTTPRSMLGNTQYLATIQKSNSSPAMFCLRHDVDGVVYKMEEARHGNDRFTHSATFNAFGYVKAGKSMAKYTSAPADHSYISICDVRSHVYLFCQPQPLGGELKNRVTGKVTSKVARQLLLSLPTHDEVMGVVALGTVLFVCTKDNMYAYGLNFSATV